MMNTIRRWVLIGMTALMAGSALAPAANALPPGGPIIREDEPPVPPPPPPPAVSMPDAAFQFVPALPNNVRNNVIAAVRTATGAPDVRAIALNGTERIGVWMTANSPAQNDARDRGLQRVDLLHAGETVAASINAALIRRSAQAVWNSLPKTLNDKGQPDPDGDLHLTNFAVLFESPNRVTARVNGWYDSTWPLPNVDFELKTSDTLSVANGAVQVATNTTLDIDAGWLTWLVDLFVDLDVPNISTGPAGPFVAMIPRQILLPGGLVADLDFRRVEVNASGIVAGGGFNLRTRMPRVSIQGPRDINVIEGTPSVTKSYTAAPVELRPGLQFQWTANGTVLNQGAATTGIRFNIGSASAGQTLTRLVSVQVTDADGLQATAQISVRIHIKPEIDDLPIGGTPGKPRVVEP